MNNTKETSKRIKEPKFYLICRIIGCILPILGIVVLIVWGTTWVPDDLVPAYLGSGIALISLGLVCILIGCIPQMIKFGIRTTRYVQQENKEDLVDVGTTLVKNVRDIKNNAQNSVAETTTYCKHCGEKIDAGSKFCNHCGGQQ